VILELSGFRRGSLGRNLRSVADLCRAFYACRREMKENKPGVAVAFGSYASVPGALAALSLRVPLVIHEQNVVPGLANRLLALGAEKLAVSFEETLRRYPRWGKKAVVTGNPLLRRPQGGEEESPWEHFDLEERRNTLAVVGGSQGAASLNRAVLEALPLWRDRDDLQVVHCVGKDKYEDFLKRAAKVDTGKLLYRPLEFVERMDLLYRAADLVVCRSGASTVSELAARGCAAILVPYPYATAAHQEANAAVLEKAGAARVIKDSELDGRRLEREVEALLRDPDRLNAMRVRSLREGKPDAARRLSELVLELAEED
jgi:UDP-N-acetylglucosamine--N-acetylmuramyl-(pentapeptide) pyrophosphoryl-undecaprenol N-acetylglucosamine transferase